MVRYDFFLHLFCAVGWCFLTENRADNCGTMRAGLIRRGMVSAFQHHSVIFAVLFSSYF
jgi:hypothetical protein